MDGRQVAAVLRAVRHRNRWTQRELAAKAKVSQARVSLAELGHIDEISLPTLESIAAALGVTLRLRASWRGGEADRLVDRSHAAVVEECARRLTRLGWVVIPEYTFNHYGERGSIDLVAWFPLTRSLLVVEAKSTITDLQDLFSGLSRKVRVAAGLLRREQAWNVQSVSVLVVLPGTTANRTIVSRHAASFAAALPARGTAIQRWLRSPAGTLRGVWFLSPTRVASTRQAIRVRNSPSSEPTSRSRA